MTNGWVDIKNTDMMLIMGGNPAENHPCGFKWAIEAKRRRNAKMIVVDPRFTRTAATADMFLQIRAGADIAFLGGIIRYALENQRIAKEYLVNYTNAPFLVKEGFKLPEDGLYSGFDENSKTYDRSSWNYEGAGGGASPASIQGEGAVPSHSASGVTGGVAATLTAKVNIDLTLQHPRCVYQLLQQQYSRYTPEMVERITGIPKDQFLKAADLFTSIRKDGDLKKVATIIYAVGWTQHTSGTQIIRAAAMLQLILGNVGRAGGGVNALRGHSNIQGATDVAGIFDNLPGYLKVPTPADRDFQGWMKRITPTSSKPGEWESYNYWSNTPRFAASLLKAMYGDAAKKENGFAFDYLPKVDREYSWTHIWDDMYNGKVKGLIAFGMNGVAIGPNSQKNIDALKKADFLVVCDIYPEETSDFWQSPGVTADEMKNIKTEVYRLPGAGFAEKDGTFVNSARWLQWKWAAVPPPGDAKLDQEILARIYLKVRELYRKEGGQFPDPILNLAWNYTLPENPSLSEVAKELNGRAITDVEDPATKQVMKAGQQLPGFSWLRDDGSTSCGNWIWCGSWTEAGALTQRRGTEDPSGLGIYPNWAWSWPMNRRVLYNRASCDLSGKPWDPARSQIWWNEGQKKWVGHDVPDFKADSPPQDHMGPFIMTAEGVGRLFGPLASFADGPFPEFYEPTESPIANPLHPHRSTNPVVKRFTTPLDKYGTPARLFRDESAPWALKGGYALELRFKAARSTVDIDLTLQRVIPTPTGGDTNQVVREMLQAVAGVSLDDWFEYAIGIPVMDLTAAPYGGARYPVEARMDERVFARFHLDAGIGDVVMQPLETIVCRDWLGFAGIESSRVWMISREQQFAEKVHAYTLPRNNANSRVKDLVDLALLIGSGGLHKSRILDALLLTFERRGTHDLPVSLVPPPADWQIPFQALAKECGLPTAIEALFAGVQEFFEEVAAQRTER